jgi:hypothetical protein
MLRSFLQMTGIILTLLASIFLLRANIGLTPEIIAKLSRTMYGYNSAVAATLAQQSVDTWVGLILLLIAFSLQMINLLLPLTIDDIGSPNRKGILISVGCCVIFIFIILWYSNKISNNILRECMYILKNK